jgi:sugar phosphate isomerase/epimerase
MKLGICASGRDLGLLAASGADYVEEHVQQFLVPELAATEFEARLRALPPAPAVRAANCFLPGDLKCVGPDVDVRRLLKYGGTAFIRARQAGIKTIVFGSAGARSIPKGFAREKAAAQFVELLKSLGPMAAEQDLTLVVEPLNTGECNFINSLQEGAELVRACGHPAVRLLCDFYHMRMEDEGAEEIVAHGALLAHAHVAEKEGRAFPGKHGEDLSDYLIALKEVEYQGAISLECGWGSLRDEAASSLASFRVQVDKAGL